MFLKAFFFESTCVLGPWPGEGLSSVGLSLAMASDFFVSLASSLVSSTSPLDVFIFDVCYDFNTI